MHTRGGEKSRCVFEGCSLSIYSTPSLPNPRSLLVYSPSSTIRFNDGVNNGTSTYTCWRKLVSSIRDRNGGYVDLITYCQKQKWSASCLLTCNTKRQRIFNSLDSIEELERKWKNVPAADIQRSRIRFARRQKEKRKFADRIIMLDDAPPHCPHRAMLPSDNCAA